MSKKFDNVVIASDLDGTYFGSGSSLVARNVERVKYFCENGGHFTFATGRLPLFVRKPLPNAKELINLCAVTGNGTCLYDFNEEKAVKEHFLDGEAFYELCGFVRDFTKNVGFRGCTRKGFVIHDMNNPYNRAEYEYFPDFMEKQILDLSDWQKLSLYKVNIMDTADVLEDLYTVLNEKFSHKLTVSRAGYSAIEVMPFGTSKAKLLREYLDERFENDIILCTVGDHDNDLEMLSIADIPVCPSNANDAVKNICKKQLCSNKEGVVADLIDMLDREL